MTHRTAPPLRAVPHNRDRCFVGFFVSDVRLSSRGGGRLGGRGCWQKKRGPQAETARVASRGRADQVTVTGVWRWGGLVPAEAAVGSGWGFCRMVPKEN